MKKQMKILLLLAVCMLLLTACGNKNRSGGKLVSGSQMPAAKTQEAEEIQNEAVDEESTQQEEQVQLPDNAYIVVLLNTSNGTLRLYDLTKQRQLDYTYNDGTVFYDKYGSYISESQLQPGRIVRIELSQKNGELVAVQLSEDAWEYDGVKRYTVDDGAQIFTIADTKYYYGDNLHVFSGEDQIRIRDIGENDILRVQGIGKEILSIAVTTGHGELQLTNTELFEGGWLRLGSMYYKVTKDMRLETQEGRYTLSVANDDGYGDTTEIEIHRNETLTVDLNELKGEGPKYCKVTFDVGVEDAVMTLDGEQVDYTQPVEIRYGIHRLEIEAAGYETWSKRLYVNSGEATIKVTLVSDGTSSEDGTEKSTETKSDTNTDAGTDTSDTKGSKAGSLAGSKAGSKAASEGTTTQGSTETEDTTESTDKKNSTKSGTTSDGLSTSEYLKTLSDIIDTLTGSSSTDSSSTGSSSGSD